ncbi:MAG: chromate transporter [Clostridiales bacterium]|nr:chromate transporter [Clostridiales bacterium]
MIYLSLLWNFLKIGMFAFGGAYGAIPLIQEIILDNNWMDEAMFTNIVGISESTPGPIMVNVATYVGNSQGGILGAAIATIGVVLPSFVIILLITISLRSWIQNEKVQAMLKGIKPCLMGIILATGIFMGFNAIFGKPQSISFDLNALLILALLAILSNRYRYILKKELSPILLIIFSAFLGIIFYK